MFGWLMRPRLPAPTCPMHPRKLASEARAAGARARALQRVESWQRSAPNRATGQRGPCARAPPL
jgi:hypothetical protein